MHEVEQQPQRSLLDVNELKLQHQAKQITWDNRTAVVHLFFNVTTAHELTLAKAANRYQKIMIGSITHELRTPLNSSTNALDLLEDEVPEHAKRYESRV